jgi:type I restriction enzyme S subunit
MNFSSDVVSANLWDIADYINGRPTKPTELVNRGIPVIKIAELSRGITNQTNLILKEVVNPKHLVATGDLLFAWSGTIGIHKYSGPEAALNQHIFKVVAREVIDQHFLQYLLENELKVLQEFVEEKKTTMGHVTIANMKTVQVTFPKSLEKQKAIASHLTTVDALISVNKSLIQTIENIVQTVFKSWFLDFDQVKSQITGEDAKTYPSAMGPIFPDSMDDSEIGPIPAGWTVKSAEELFEIGIGRTPPRIESEWFCAGDAGVPWVSIRDMGTFGTFSESTREGLTEEAITKFRVPIVPENTVLMSFKLTVGKLCITDGTLVTNEAIAHFKLSSDSLLDSYFTFLWLKNHDMNSLDSTSSIGTATNSGVIKQIKFLVPTSEILASFHELVSPFFDELKLLSRKQLALIGLREALLPRLISGEMQIIGEKSVI